MTRDNPATRFDWMARAPYAALFAGQPGGSVAVPSWEDRALASLTDATPGSVAFELVPQSCHWDATNLLARAAELAASLGISVRLRLEKGLGHGTGLSDEETAWAAVAAAIGRCAGEDVRDGPDAVLFGGGFGAWQGCEALAVVLAGHTGDSARDAALLASVQRTLNEAGATMVRTFPPLTAVAMCPSLAVARHALQESIDALAEQGVWPRGRAGAPGRGAQANACDVSATRTNSAPPDAMKPPRGEQ